MNIRIELDDKADTEEIIIRCKNMNERVLEIQRAVSNITNQTKNFVFYQNDTEYYLELDNILFFETSGNVLNAHTIDDIYTTKYKLYELEDLLPGCFMRVSKSTIVNVDKIFSITRNLTASSEIQFRNTHKIVYVSRNYYKALKIKIEEKRNMYEK